MLPVTTPREPADDRAMTPAPVTTLDAAHAAAATALDELHAEAMSALEALFRSFGMPAAEEEAASLPQEEAGEPARDDIEPLTEELVGPATLELPRRLIIPVAAA